MMHDAYSTDSNLARVLLVDDDQALCELLSEFLTREGFGVSARYSGESAIQAIQQEGAFDAVVLDIMMPGMSGLEVLQSVRRDNSIPIIMLTGRGDDIDRIVGLEMGADDYLGKPCNPRELSARLRAVLRRTQPARVSEASSQLALKGIVITPETQEVEILGEPVNLTAAEQRVLYLLLQQPGQIISKASLTEAVLHRKLSAHDRSIDVHVSRIRQKLAKYPTLGLSIKSVRGLGYQLVEGA